MPKFTPATAALLLRRPLPPAADVPSAVHSATRTRVATRRLRATCIHETYFDLSALELTGGH
jgi:hypothetical protein